MPHTKGKLKLDEVKRLILDETGVPVASVATYGGRRIEEQEGNAARIVHCWNFHEQLVESLRWAMKHLNRRVTWEQVVSAKPGEVLADRFEDGLRFMIIRGPCYLCAYIGIPESHPLAGRSYDDITCRAHGGLTYSKAGDGQLKPAGFWFYGWNYGHYDDYMISDHHSKKYSAYNEKLKKWGVEEVNEDSEGALYDFKKLMKLSEAIASNRKEP